MAKVTVIIDGDERGLKKSVDRSIREMSRLEKAAERSANPYTTNKLPSQFNTLNRQQFQEVQRIARERARLVEIQARKEAQLAVQSARARTQAENNYFRYSEAQRRRDFSEYQRIERQKTAVANAEARKRQSFAQLGSRVGGGFQSAGQGLQSGGATLTATLTAPIVAIGTLGVKAALELDKARTKLTALEGDSTKAAARMQQLFELADRSVGVTRAAALETFAQLKGIGGLAEETINGLIGTIGKLNAAFNLEDQQGFIRNLVQIFTQGFERADIKEAIGRVPIFEQLLESAFGTKDGAKLKALKESGKLTLDAWMQGLIDAVNADQRVANVSENLTVKLAKGFERLNQALAPIGDVILQSVVPIFEQLAPYVQQASDYFKSLSPSVQQAAVALAALAAAAGPLLIFLGSIVVVIGSAVTALSALAASAATIGTVALVIAGLGIALAPLIPAAAEFYLVWTTNFGGVRDFILQVIGVLQKAYNAFLTEFRAMTQQITTEALQFWQENGADILRAVETVSNAIKTVIQAFVSVVAAIWREHGDEIKTVVVAAWEVVKTVTIEALRVVGNVIKLVAAVINGDWAKAWAALKGIVVSAFNVVVAIIQAQITTVITIIKGWIAFMLTLQSIFYKALYEAGKQIIAGLVNGILSGRSTVFETIKNIAISTIGVFKSTLGIQSPSKVTNEIGQNLGEGLAQGIEKKTQRVGAAARRIAAEAVKELREAVKEFNRLAGASPEAVATFQEADRTRTAAQSQREIIDLRRELGVGFGQGLPSTVSGTEDEVAALRRQKQAAEDLSATYDKLRDDFNGLQDLQKQYAEDVEKALAAQQAAGEAALLDLQEEIDLTGVLDEETRRNIENYYEIERLREQLKADGFGDAMIDEAVRITEANQLAREEFEKILAVRRQVASAAALGADLEQELEFLQRGGRELTEYEKVLRRIEKDYKDIEPAQKEYLLNMARQVDAQREFNRQYEETFHFIRDAFDILTDESQSFGDNLKNLFKSITDRFKQMVLDMAAAWLTNKIFGTGGAGGGGIGGTPNFNPASGGGQSNVLSALLGSLFGGAGGGSRGVTATASVRDLSGNIAGTQTVRPQGGILGAIFGKGGIFGSQGFGNNVGTFTGIGGLAAIGGGLLGGRIGGLISNVGSGLAIGAQIGTSVFPGLGTLAGALIGAAGGFLASIFGGLFGSPKRKRDKEEKLPALQQGFADALKALRELAANKKAIQQDPSGAISRADELRASIASGFGIQFESSKYRQQAQNLIRQRLAEADAIIAQIKAFAKQAEAASLRPILPEFADGGMISKFIQQNGLARQFSGLVPGVYDRKDDKIIKVSGNEVVLPPHVWQPITPYLREKRVPGFADGGLVGAVSTVSASRGDINVTIYMEGDIVPKVREVVIDELGSERGIRATKVNVQTLRKNKEI